MRKYICFFLSLFSLECHSTEKNIDYPNGSGFSEREKSQVIRDYLDTKNRYQDGKNYGIAAGYLVELGSKIVVKEPDQKDKIDLKGDNVMEEVD